MNEELLVKHQQIGEDEQIKTTHCCYKWNIGWTFE
jgi:hypothetical protein